MSEYSIIKSGSEPAEYLTGNMRTGRYEWTKNREFRYTFSYDLAAVLCMEMGGYLNKE